MAEILLVDDDSQVLKVFTAYLEKAGHVITTAANGAEGMKLLESRNFDLVITDILMPERDGFELMFSMRKQLSRPKIIAVSGGSPSLGHDYVLGVAKTIAADRILQKPVDFETLTQTVREVLQQGH